jgi:hypothetical protein
MRDTTTVHKVESQRETRVESHQVLKVNAKRGMRMQNTILILHTHTLYS